MKTEHVSFEATYWIENISMKQVLQGFRRDKFSYNYNKTIDNLVNLGFHNLCSFWEYIYDSFPGKIRENIIFWLPIFDTSWHFDWDIYFN